MGMSYGWCMRPLAQLAKLTARSHQSTKDGIPTSFYHPSFATTALSLRQLTDIMGFYKYTALALLALRAVSVFAADAVSQWPEFSCLPCFKKLTSACPQVEEELETPPTIPNLAVSASASFPNAEVFGVKLINGHATQAVLAVTNNEAEPILLTVIGGALSTLQPLAPGIHPSAAIVRNITATRYDVEIPAGEKQTLPFTFTTDLHPQDLRLNLIALVSSQAGNVYQVQAYNETVSVVEAATSIFDPQM